MLKPYVKTVCDNRFETLCHIRFETLCNTHFNLLVCICIVAQPEFHKSQILWRHGLILFVF